MGLGEEIDDYVPETYPALKVWSMMLLVFILGAIVIWGIGYKLCPPPECPGHSTDPAPSPGERSVLVK